MSWLDGTLLGVLGLGAVLGALTGFFVQLARILGVAVALYLSILCNDGIASYVHQHVMPAVPVEVVQAAAYLAVFVAIFVLFLVLTAVMRYGLRGTGLELMDRLLGAVLGCAKMAIALAAVCLILVHYPSPATHEVLNKSVLAPALAQGMELSLVLLPADMRREVHEGLSNLRAAEPRQARPVIPRQQPGE